MRPTSEAWPGMGERIRQRLQELGYERVEDFTQDKRYGLGLFYKWLGEKVYPSKANIIRLARDLGVTLRWLMWGTATHIDGVPVDVLAVPPADLMPETMAEKRAFMEAAFAPPKKKGRRRHPIAGGSVDDGTQGVAELADVLLLIGRWLSRLLAPWAQPLLHPMVSAQAAAA